MKLLQLVLAASAGTLMVACNTNEKPQNEELNEQVIPSLTKLWETDTVLTTCESVLYNEAGDFMYVSNINGMPTEKNGAGYISKLAADGQIITLKWATGLHAPKGLGLMGGRLYVTDIDKIVAIDTATGQIAAIYTPDTAAFLNDISVHNGVVYVSDMHLGHVLKIQNDSLSVMLSGLQNLNGLYADQDGLYTLYAAGMARIGYDDLSITAINDSVTGGDGLERISDSVFVASRWKGDVFLVRGSRTDLLLDTQAEESKTADIGLNRKNNTVYIPTFFKNKVVAYQLTY